MKEKENPTIAEVKAAQEEMLPKLGGGHLTVYGLNKCINPRTNPIYSVNLYQFLTHKHKYLTNIFLDPGDGKHYIGLKEKDGLWCGAELIKVNEFGSKVKVFSYPPSRTKDWEDITRKWWAEYFANGTSIFDKKSIAHLLISTGKTRI